MLCGEVAQSGRAAGRPLSLPLSLAAACAEGTRSPYSALLQALAASADDDDADADAADAAMEHLMGRDAATGTPTDNIFLENGLLSYENPNYRGLDACRLDDALNSNSDDLYAELLLLSRGATPASKTAAPTSTAGRRGYATLDVGSMGVDVVAGPQTDTEPLADNRQHREDSEVAGLDNLFNDNVNLVARAMGRMRTQPDLIECSAELRSLKSCAAEDEGSRDEEEGKGQEGGSPPGSPSPPDSPDEGGEATLPAGWERHEDNDGPYFWHIKSGTIQREAPTRAQPDVRGRAVAPPAQNEAPTVVRSQTSWELDGRRANNDARRPRSFPEKPPPVPAPQTAQTLPASSGAVRFAVRSLGWVEISELDLTPERSSRAVNKCIVDLSLGRHDLLDVVGRWGDGKELFMDLDDGALKLVDPDNLAGLNTQPIHTIRVWGVGRDNGRDFAYVARDRATRRHMCHVFRCDIPARTIANTLRDICKRIMIERSLAHAQDSRAARPTDLPTQARRLHRTQPPTQPLTQGQSFPTPMEEPRKVLRAQYLGSTQVSRATGVDTLNDAIALLVATLPAERWLSVNVAVAPSMISILRPEDGSLVAECRVRYLSFLGIGRDVKQCGFIVHTAQDLFVAHVFHCEPSSGALCKTVEAACKLRYQKCLDAHPQGAGGRGAAGGGATTPGRGLGATLKSLVGSFTGRRLRASQS